MVTDLRQCFSLQCSWMWHYLISLTSAYNNSCCCWIGDYFDIPLWISDSTICSAEILSCRPGWVFWECDGVNLWRHWGGCHLRGRWLSLGLGPTCWVSLEDWGIWGPSFIGRLDTELTVVVEGCFSDWRFVANAVLFVANWCWDHCCLPCI